RKTGNLFSRRSGDASRSLSQKALVIDIQTICVTRRSRYLERFRNSGMHVEYIAMTRRDQRAEFIARRFATYLRGKVLDVGCDKARLKELVPGIDYLGVDVSGTPDLVVNLE